MSQSPSSLSAAEKKRLRDRRAQQALRNKKLKHTTQLEDKVAHCERYHDDSTAQHLLQVIEGLQQQNELLRQRQDSLKALVGSWDGDTIITTTSSATEPTLPFPQPQLPPPQSPIHTLIPKPIPSSTTTITTTPTA
ncbi:hypothetical protein BO71DRAFT_488993, partial [Aspergillus ellipticus CBS 707.79]